MSARNKEGARMPFALVCVLGAAAIGITGAIVLHLLPPPVAHDTGEIPQATDALKPAPTNPALGESATYKAQADEILRGRQAVIEVYSQVTAEKSANLADPVYGLSAALGKRREVTTKAIEALNQLAVPDRMVEVQKLQLDMLAEDLRFGEQIGAAIRAEDINSAVSISKKRDEHQRYMLGKIAKEYEKMGVDVT